MSIGDLISTWPPAPQVPVRESPALGAHTRNADPLTAPDSCRARTTGPATGRSSGSSRRACRGAQRCRDPRRRRNVPVGARTRGGVASRARSLGPATPRGRRGSSRSWSRLPLRRSRDGWWTSLRTPPAAGSRTSRASGTSSSPAPAPGAARPLRRRTARVGTGLVLGREGPTVHMGSADRRRSGPTAPGPSHRCTGAAGVARRRRVGGRVPMRPIGGALFVFEEVTRSFRPRLVMTTLIGCVIAVSCSRLILGDRPDFLVVAPETSWPRSCGSSSRSGWPSDSSARCTTPRS